MRTVGIKLADGSFYPVMEEGTAQAKKLDLTTAHENQTCVMVDMYRSKSGTMEGAEYIDTLKIDNLIAHPNGEPDISFNVELDENGELKASIADPETGATSDSQITLVSRTIEERLQADDYTISYSALNEDNTNLENQEQIMDTEEKTVEEKSNSGAVAAGAVAGGGLLAAAAAIRKQEEEKQNAETLQDNDFNLGDPEYNPDASSELDDMDLDLPSDSDFTATENFETEEKLPDMFAEIPSDETVISEQPIATYETTTTDDEFDLTDNSTNEDLPDFDADFFANTTEPETSDTLQVDPTEEAPFEMPSIEETDNLDDDDFAADSLGIAAAASTFDLPEDNNETFADNSDFGNDFNTDFNDSFGNSFDDNSNFEDSSLDEPYSSDSDGMSSAGGISFTGLYDKETVMGEAGTNQEDSNSKGTKAPVIICIICAIICLLATAFLLFVIPSKFNLLSKKDKTEKTEVTQKTEETVKIPEAVVVEEKEPEPVKELVPAAKEDEVVIIEKAEEVIPLPPPAVETKPAEVKYKIKWGDTLWDIADTYYKNPWRYKKIASYNKIKNPDHIISGTVITIPAE